MDEKELIYKCKQNDPTAPNAFGELVLKYQDQIFNVICRMTGDYQEAADICQETFIKAYQNIKRFRGQSAFLTWTYQIAINLCRNYKRAKKTSPRTLPLEQAYRTSDPSVDIFQHQACPPARREQTSAVQQAINSLDEGLRTIVVLRDIEDRSYAEISKIVRCPVGTVRSRLAQARQILKERLKNFL